MNYFVRLDFLRFIAVGFVILQHWFKLGTYLGVDLGRIGVLIFFTLSGFLISGILFDSKDDINNGQSTFKKVLSSFYIRRLLRISPIYFITLIIVFLFTTEYPVGRAPWYFLYASNIYSYINQDWDGLLGPFWSLAVEEQFYLVWPFLVLMTNKANLKKLLIVSVFLGPVFRYASLIFAKYQLKTFDPSVASIVLMPSCVDCFAWGGLLALYHRKIELGWVKKLVNNVWIHLLVAIGTVLFVLIPETELILVLYPSVISVASFLLIVYLTAEKTYLADKIFKFKPFLGLGKISYGLYLYHGPFPLILGLIDIVILKVGASFTLFDALATYSEFTRLMIWTLLLVLLSTLSYLLFESPINSLKKKFKYR